MFILSEYRAIDAYSMNLKSLDTSIFMLFPIEIKEVAKKEEEIICRSGESRKEKGSLFASAKF